MRQRCCAVLLSGLCVVALFRTFDPEPNDPPSRTGGSGTRLVLVLNRIMTFRYWR